jgi:hypothetical protein
MGDNTEMGTIPRFVGIDGRTKPAAADMSAALWAGWALLPAFEAVTGALVTALEFGWLGSIGPRCPDCNSVERDPGKVLQEDLPGSSPQLLVAAVSITVQVGATVGLSALGVSNRGARRHTMREPRIQRNLRPNAEFSPSTLRIIVSPGNCTLSWMRRTHCRASHLAACGHTVLPKIGPVIALRRRTDYQSPDWLSGAEDELSQPRFR